MAAGSFLPPVRTLMGPGPSDVHPRVLEAISRPTIGHLDPMFVSLMDDMKGLLQHVLRTENRLTLAVSAPGSAGMEMAFTNLVEPGDTVVVGVNGVFGGRLAEMARRMRAEVVEVEAEWGRIIELGQIEEILQRYLEAWKAGEVAGAGV